MPVIEIPPGMKLEQDQPAWAKRIEAKLDRLLAELAEDAQEEDRGRDLEGNPLPAPRDENEPL